MNSPLLIFTRPERARVIVDDFLLLDQNGAFDAHRDLGRKLRSYARADFAEYWVVDGSAQIVHQLSSPDGDGYREHRGIAFGEQVTSVTVACLPIPCMCG